MEKFDQELVKEVLSGSLSSFEILVKRYQAKIYRYVSSKISNRYDAEDVTQEAFIKAYKGLKGFKQDQPFSPWLYKIATNSCYDLIKKNRNLEKLNHEIIDEGNSLLDIVIQKDQFDNLVNKIKSLPQIYQQPIIGFYFFDFNYKALANSLNLPLNTLRTRLKRGREMLAKEFSYEK